MSTPDAKKPKIAGENAKNVPKCPVQDLMRPYYGKLFPHQHMYKWLVYGNDGKHPQADTSFFKRREFCFTLDGDIFVRYQSFKDATDMAAAIINKCPAKIDIGPVYSQNPQDRLKFGASFQPVERELVFDIDLTDYDDVRTCGKEGHICNKCWPLMAVAIKIVDRSLREDFGFANILWVFSGRRGIHCWVCDPSARKLTDEQRASIANYFAVYKGHENDKARVALGFAGMHPSVQKAGEFLEVAWKKRILQEQQLLENEAMREAMLSYLPTEDLVAEVRSKWDHMSTATEKKDINVARWDALVYIVHCKIEGEKHAAKKASGTAASTNIGASAVAGRPLLFKLQKCVNEIIFAFSYPRLDMEVSKKMNHLLKAPFCVHPKTGKVCIPIDPAAADEFDPETVPTVYSLLDELRQAKEAEEASGEIVAKKGEEWSKTQLAESVELFQTAFLDGCLATNRVEQKNKARLIAAAGAKSDMSF